MKKIKRYRNCVERFISSDRGQRFFNFAYSIGAAIVIWGVMFKILRLPGGEVLLAIGMGTEVLMFILTAFDLPSREYHWEDVFPELGSQDEGKTPKDQQDRKKMAVRRAVVDHTDEMVQNHVPAAEAETVGATAQFADRMQAVGEQLEQLFKTTEQLNKVSDTLLSSYRSIIDNSDNISASTTGYVDQMQALNRNISGLNTIYEIQLKSVSSQLDAIDRVNKGIKDIRDMYERSAAQSIRYCEETEKMTLYMQQLNQVYENMIQAMTVNMYRPMGMAETAKTRESIDN